MFISAPGAIFLFYLAVLVSFGSETIYSVPKSRFESAIVLFLSSFVYAALFAFSYYTKYMNIQRQETIDKWINEHDIRQVEMETYSPQGQQPQKSQLLPSLRESEDVPLVRPRQNQVRSSEDD